MRFFFQNMKLRNKSVLILTVLALLTFLIAWLFSFLPYRAYNQEFYASGMQTLTLFADKLQGQLDAHAELSYQMLSDNVIQTNLTEMRKNHMHTQKWLTAMRTISRHFPTFCNRMDDLVSIRLETIQGISYSDNRGMSAINQQDILELIRLAQEEGGSAIWKVLPAPVSRIILARTIREVDGLTMQPLGTIIMEIDLKSMFERCLSVMKAVNCPLSAAVFDGDQCLYASDSQAQMYQLNRDGYEILNEDGASRMVSRYTTSQGWHCMMVRSFEGITKSIRGAIIRASMISALLVSAAVIVMILLMRMILYHMDVLLNKIDRFSRGELPTEADTAPYLHRKDELGRLHRHFDRMITAYDRVVRDNYNQQLAIKDAEARNLRAQIRPHFLYNTLQMIYLMAKDADQPRIAGITEAMGKMMHATLNEKRDVITVGEDWQIAREYLRIQQYRYQDHLQVDYELNGDQEKNLIPSMSLQPLIENAIHYAAEEMLEVCRIRVWGETHEDSVDICVEDNGPGMDEDILRKLESGEIQPDGLGIGMANIHRRIQLKFSPDYGLLVRCRDGRTQVFIHLPRKGAEKDDQAADGR